MEKELNIAAILKDKSKGTKLWSPIFGECTFDGISCDNSAFGVDTNKSVPEVFYANGKYDENGECTIFPSKEMRDWSKFAWKKGDVLVNSIGFKVLFDSWANGTYTGFYAKIDNLNNGGWYDTDNYTLATEKEAKSFIKRIEQKLGGKLNLSTLQIEKPKQEFKDGDVVYSEGTEHEVSSIFIVQDMGNYLSAYILLREDNQLAISENSLGLGLIDSKMRLATDSEKQQLFEALAKENKAWDAEKKMLVDLPKKCELKPMDWCLMRFRHRVWNLCQFAFINKSLLDNPVAVGGNIYEECIPYNDQTKHLIGTTDEWKGGEG